MKRREIKEKIKSAFSENKPNLKDIVLEDCAREPQLPKPEPTPSLTLIDRIMGILERLSARQALAAAICLFVLISGISFGLMMPKGGEVGDSGAEVITTASSVVYLDVNPSVKIELDGEDKVLRCTAENADADHIIEGLSLAGKTIREAIAEIMGSMQRHDCLSSAANSILISVDAAEDKGSALLTEITEQINISFEGTGLECSIIAQSVNVSEALEAEAAELGVSVGKMHLIDKMVNSMEDYSDEDKTELATMSIKELNLIYSSRDEEDGDEEFEDDISSGSVGGYITDNESLLSFIDKLGISKNNIEKFRLRVGFEKIDSTHRMIYIITLKVENDPSTHVIKIDCITGDILSHETQ